MFFNKGSNSASGISSIHLCAAGLLCLAFGLFLHCFAAKSLNGEFDCYVNIIFENIGFIGNLTATLGAAIFFVSILFAVIKQIYGK